MKFCTLFGPTSGKFYSWGPRSLIWLRQPPNSRPNHPRGATTPRRHLLEPGRHIDWAFVRGSSQPVDGRVLKSVKASDHYPIFFELQLSAAQQKITSSGYMPLF